MADGVAFLWLQVAPEGGEGLPGGVAGLAAVVKDREGEVLTEAALVGV